MSFLDRLFFSRKLRPSITIEPARTAPGPMTVHEAWALAKPQATSMDKGAMLLLATSGTDLQGNGRSFTWEFLFHLKGRGARVLLTYGPPPDAKDIETAPVFVEKRISVSAEEPKNSLPMEFRNSPEVVAELAQAGVDFVAGPSDMKLESGFSADGRPVWVTYFWDKKMSVPFEKRTG